MSQSSTGRSPWERGTLRPRVLSIMDTARYIGRGRSFVYDLIARGEIQALKSGGRTLPILDTVDAYLDRCPLADVRPAHPERPKDSDAKIDQHERPAVVGDARAKAPLA
jgi:excisionase family DNA binding protein